MSPLVLYIEDRADNRNLVKRILMADDVDILEASNAIEGIALALEHVPDLILMDINMPGLDGITATSKIREHVQLDHVPVIALTANVMKGDRERVLDAGCDGYIPKPIDVDKFPQEIKNMIKKGRRQ
jgi:two-component system, cell cycle response regulator DivK